MHSSLNPYSPGSGLRPPALAGREAQLEAFDTLLARTGNGLQDRGMILWGLRGVGKTVLLNRLAVMARDHRWLVVEMEARPGAAGAATNRAQLGRELLKAGRRTLGARVRGRAKDAIGSIASFSFRIGVTGMSLGIDRREGRADSGDLETDLEEVVEDVTSALAPSRRGFAIFVDEMQELDEELLASLLSVQHLAGQRGWPFYVIGAGLPNLPARLSEARSYAERLFDYQEIGTLSTAAADAALVQPARSHGASFVEEALALLVDASGRYPYFIQEYGKAIWDVAQETPFTIDDAHAAVESGTAQLDQGFFPARWDRATPAERAYLRAMAMDGDAGSRTGAVAERLGKDAGSLSPVRAQLIAKGLVYAPEHGRIAFTVPGMAAFIERQRTE